MNIDNLERLYKKRKTRKRKFGQKSAVPSGGGRRRCRARATVGLVSRKWNLGNGKWEVAANNPEAGVGQRSKPRGSAVSNPSLTREARPVGTLGKGAWALCGWTGNLEVPSQSCKLQIYGQSSSHPRREKPKHPKLRRHIIPEPISAPFKRAALAAFKPLISRRPQATCILPVVLDDTPCVMVPTSSVN